MKKIHHFFLLLLLIAIPSILAPILYITVVQWYFSYGGSESVWITFWGNYLGSVVTGIISFVILWKTIQSNKDENQAIINANKEAELLRIKYDFYLRFKEEVSTRLSKIDLSSYIGVYFDEKAPADEALKRLELFHREMIENYNSFVVLYQDSHDDFLTKYSAVVNEFTDRIHLFMDIFHDKKASNDPQIILDFNKKLKIEIARLEDLKESLNSLWEAANQEISKLKVIDIPQV